MERFRETTFILADPSPEMLQIAKNKLGSNDRVKILDPVGAQDLALGFKADVITAIQAHHYLTKEEREKATRVCFELLAPKGIYITFENIRPLSSEGVRLGKAYWSSFQLGKRERSLYCQQTYGAF